MNAPPKIASRLGCPVLSFLVAPAAALAASSVTPTYRVCLSTAEAGTTSLGRVPR